MSGLRTAGLLIAAASIALVLPAAPAAAKGNGGNSASAKTCQKGGWEQYVTSAGAAFASEKECTAYAAKGGTLAPKPEPEPYAVTRAACEGIGGAFTVVDSSDELWSYAQSPA